MYEQICLFATEEVLDGTYTRRRGKLLTWDELRAGITVLYDCSTQSKTWVMITTVDKVIKTPDGPRVVLRGGKHRLLINRVYMDDGSVRLYREGQL